MYARFCLNLLCSTLFTLLGVALFNVAIDSANIFRTANLKEAAQNVTHGKNVAFVGNIDERLYQAYLIESIKEPPHTIVLGSSRIMQLRQAYLKGEKSFYNHGVSGANMLDYYALLGLYILHHQKLPKRIIFGLDPWIFNANNGDARYLSVKYAIEVMKAYIYGKKYDEKSLLASLSLKAKEAISFAQFQNNLQTWLKKGIDQRKTFIVQSADTPYIVRIADNTIYYPLSQRTPSLEQIKHAALGFRNYHIVDFYRLDIEPFLVFMDFLQKEGVELVFLLTPYNPYLYEALRTESNKYNMIIKAQSFIKEYALKHNIEIYGDYDGGNLGLKIDDFIDGVHTKDKVLGEIFKNYEK